MATKAEKNFEKALLELASEDVSTALSVLTGCFVSLTLEVLRRKGHVPDGDIKIDGGDQCWPFAEMLNLHQIANSPAPPGIHG